MSIEFETLEDGRLTYGTACSVVWISKNGDTVDIDGCLDSNELEAILSKMKELQSEGKK